MNSHSFFSNRPKVEMTSQMGIIQPNLETVELPVTVTQEHVTIIWKVLSQVTDTLAFVVYNRPPSGNNSSCTSSTTSEAVDVDSSNNTENGGNSTSTTYLQSGIALQLDNYNDIEVKALEVGLYVLQLKAAK